MSPIGNQRASEHMSSLRLANTHVVEAGLCDPPTADAVLSLEEAMPVQAPEVEVRNFTTYLLFNF